MDFLIGGYAEFVSMPKARVRRTVTFPANFGWSDFAVVPKSFRHMYARIQGCTFLIWLAWQTVVASLHAKKGESLLIRCGTSIVGLRTAEIAKLYGLQVYSATRSSESDKAFAVGG